MLCDNISERHPRRRVSARNRERRSCCFHEYGFHKLQRLVPTSATAGRSTLLSHGWVGAYISKTIFFAPVQRQREPEHNRIRTTRRNRVYLDVLLSAEVSSRRRVIKRCIKIKPKNREWLGERCKLHTIKPHRGIFLNLGRA